jgi:hypothetical protein
LTISFAPDRSPGRSRSPDRLLGRRYRFGLGYRFGEHRVLDGLLIGLLELGDLGLRVTEPVSRPDPVESPAQPLQVLAPQAVPVADAP